MFYRLKGVASNACQPLRARISPAGETLLKATVEPCSTRWSGPTPAFLGGAKRDVRRRAPAPWIRARASSARLATTSPSGLRRRSTLFRASNRGLSPAEVREGRIHGLRVLEGVGVGNVDDVEEDVSLLELFERGAERGDESASG